MCLNFVIGIGGGVQRAGGLKAYNFGSFMSVLATEELTERHLAGDGSDVGRRKSSLITHTLFDKVSTEPCSKLLFTAHSCVEVHRFLISHKLKRTTINAGTNSGITRYQGERVEGRYESRMGSQGDKEIMY